MVRHGSGACVRSAAKLESVWVVMTVITVMTAMKAAASFVHAGSIKSLMFQAVAAKAIRNGNLSTFGLLHAPAPN